MVVKNIPLLNISQRCKKYPFIFKIQAWEQYSASQTIIFCHHFGRKTHQYPRNGDCLFFMKKLFDSLNSQSMAEHNEDNSRIATVAVVLL